MKLWDIEEDYTRDHDNGPWKSVYRYYSLFNGARGRYCESRADAEAEGRIHENLILLAYPTIGLDEVKELGKFQNNIGLPGEILNS